MVRKTNGRRGRGKRSNKSSSLETNDCDNEILTLGLTGGRKRTEKEFGTFLGRIPTTRRRDQCIKHNKFSFLVNPRRVSEAGDKHKGEC